jgi:hypothetical protein
MLLFSCTAVRAGGPPSARVCVRRPGAAVPSPVGREDIRPLASEKRWHEDEKVLFELILVHIYQSIHHWHKVFSI